MRVYILGYPIDIIEAAESLYLKKNTAKEIQKALNLKNARVVYQWRKKYGWDDKLQNEAVEVAISRRICLLVDKEEKSNADFIEIDKLTTQLLKLAKVSAVKAKINQEKVQSEKKATKRRKGKNDVSELTKDDFNKVADKLLFDYQKKWRQVKNNKKLSRSRFMLKSRQIGATYYCSFEAFEDAVINGDNQIFLSASRDQANVFRAYIIAIAKQFFDIELSGKQIVLSNDAVLRFISTNSTTAQGYNGHVYFDEVFWTRDWKNLQKVASGMASHKKWRKTYVSTPSTVNHEAYAFWSGAQFNKGKPKSKQVEFDVSHAALADGRLCEDGIWRQIVTIEDAEASGCDLFDLEQLKMEYSDEDYLNLFMCEFIDDSHAILSLSELQDCYCDRAKWSDFDKNAARPFGNQRVWLGFDPSRTRDNSTVAIIAPPVKNGGKFRVLDRIHFRGQNFTYQANQIKQLTEKYNVEHIGIDTTGIGYGVYDLVKAFYPSAVAIPYSLETKTRLVLKAVNVIQNKRLQFDASQTEITQSFLAIKKVITASGANVTYKASRTVETGHADVAFAIMHALYNEPLNTNQRKSSYTH